MAEPISRRQFLRNSAALAGAVVVFDPSWLFAGDIAPHQAADHGGPPPGQGGRPGSEGVSAQVEYGDGFIRWTRLGEDYTLELRQSELVMKAPTHSVPMVTIPLAEFESGRGHQEVARHFGAATLAQLRTEVGHRAVLIAA